MHNDGLLEIVRRNRTTGQNSDAFIKRHNGKVINGWRPLWAIKWGGKVIVAFAR